MHIGLIGKAGSGKDTVGARLVQRFAYTRVAFADPLKTSALELNPIVSTRFSGGDEFAMRLSRCVDVYGWERAKREYPEVRRLLQRYGQTMRDLDPDVWIRLASHKINIADRWNMPVVVTDVRYANEAATLQSRGFTMVRVVRHGAGLPGGNGMHDSETELDDYRAPRTLHNVSTLSELYAQVDALVS